MQEGPSSSSSSPPPIFPIADDDRPLPPPAAPLPDDDDDDDDDDGSDLLYEWATATTNVEPVEDARTAITTAAISGGRCRRIDICSTCN